MKKGKLSIVMLIYIVQIFILSITTIYADNIKQDKTDVLFLSSFESSFIGFEEQVKGVKSGIGNNSNIRIEYIDSKILENENKEKDFYNLLQGSLEMYENIGVVIAGDNEALEFCIKYRDSLFKDIPISFLGAKDDEIKKKALEYDKVSGISSDASIRENIEFIKKFHPSVDTITFIDNYAVELYDEVISDYPDFKFNWIITEDKSVDEVKQNLSQLDQNDAVIQLTVREFKDIDSLRKNEINKIIVDSCNTVPIYNTIEYDIGQGSIGGKVINYFEQGKKAGEVAIGLINGENGKDLYIDDDINKYVFDYKAMKKFGIKKRELPKGSIILNNPYELLYEYKTVAIGVAMIVLGLFSIVLALLVYIYYRRKYVKQILVARKQAEEANMIKTHFISNISHELKTPINVIMSAIQLAKLNESTYSGHSNNLTIIDKNCNRLLRLLNNIIDVQKAELDEMNLKLTKVNIVELIEELIISVVPYAEAMNLSLVFDTNEEDVCIEVDINKIERVILNLLSNAIKFSKENGEIRVDLKFEDKLYIIVEDDGIGIDESDINNIFEKFTQIDNSLFRKNEGSGIGLSIVKSFVKLHDGKIYAESEINKGTRFIVELPINNTKKVEESNFIKSNQVHNVRLELSDIYV